MDCWSKRQVGDYRGAMGAQRAPAQDQAVDVPDGFGVAVVREDGKWRCSAMRPAA